MPIPVNTYPELTNPYQAGQNLMDAQTLNKLRQAQTAQENIRNMYLPQSLSGENMKTDLANQMQKIALQYAPQTQQAELAYKQQMAPHMAAQTQNLGLQNQYYVPNMQSHLAHEGAQTSTSQQALDFARKTQQYDVDKAKIASITDPVLRRVAEFQLAQKQGLFDKDTTGIPGAPRQQLPQSPEQINTLQQYGQQSLPGQPAPVSQVTPQTAPKLFEGAGLQNWIQTGNPGGITNAVQMAAIKKGMETEAAQEVKSYHEAFKKASDTATVASNIEKTADDFWENYKKSNYKGGITGDVPTSGLGSIPFRTITGPMSAEQSTDRATADLTTQVAKLIAGGKVTNYEMLMAGKTKPSRQMDEQAAKETVDFLKAKSTRMKEEQDFLNAAKHQGIDAATSQSLWQKYNDQRAIYDIKNKKINKQNFGTWKPFISPEAVNAVKQGEKFVSMPKFNNKNEFQDWYRTLPADIQQEVMAKVGK